MMTSVHVTCIIRCPHLYQKRQSPQAPSRRPCTAAHASQIPTRLGSTYGPRYHTFPQLPHTVTKLQKSRHWFRRDQRVQFHKSQPTPTSKHPGPALHLRKPSAGQVQQMLQTCDWGCRHLLHGYAHTARTAMVMHARVCAHFHGHAHGHGHARTVTHMHGHSHTFTGMCTATSTSGHASDETSVRLTQIKRQPVYSNALRLRNISADLRVQPAYSKRLGGMGVNDGVDDDDRGGAAACV